MVKASSVRCHLVKNHHRSLRKKVVGLVDVCVPELVSFELVFIILAILVKVLLLLSLG